ncbi:carboxypeptidase-like regulatory domain-containing protein [Pontibacter sp. 172403-2]|uniref:carboxypeptidase-like regulatory domain-containing protein n=1 Tax=Pontibacter rufus TaxID=2791028 RepID=UPI0018AFDD90|nr:carboxypeptidase-like regulatory domain-containing protein [Pontibacter sp. 172403-2]MBF9252230.1 carboxypeptidase-like regulatory domain-containing protein [Pontibacter sp. 172403-2]
MLLSALAQSQTVQGSVTDGQGELLPGVTVLLKGTSTGTSTNADGTYVHPDTNR